MKLNMLSQFRKSESGAVTVDWVVLTAAIVGIAIAVITLVSGGVEDASEGINDELVLAGGLGDWFSSAAYGTDSDFVPYQMGVIGIPDSGYNEFYDQALNGGDTQAYYDMAYETATTSPEALTMDRLAAAEQAMMDSGSGIPDGNTSAAELQSEDLS